MLADLVQFQLMICGVGGLAGADIACVVPRPDVRLLVSFQSDVREVSRLVGAQLALEHSLRLVVVHHVLLEQHFCSEYFGANVARALLDSVRVAHVIEE